MDSLTTQSAQTTDLYGLNQLIAKLIPTYKFHVKHNYEKLYTVPCET